MQHEIIRVLAQESGNIFMVGDEDQSIYGFRAAYPQALMDFEKTYPGAQILLMEENYRSREPILDAANRFVARNRYRRPKTIQPTQGAGEPLQIVTVRRRADQLPFCLRRRRTAKRKPPCCSATTRAPCPSSTCASAGACPMAAKTSTPRFSPTKSCGMWRISLRWPPVPPTQMFSALLLQICCAGHKGAGAVRLQPGAAVRPRLLDSPAERRQHPPAHPRRHGRCGSTAWPACPGWRRTTPCGLWPTSWATANTWTKGHGPHEIGRAGNAGCPGGQPCPPVKAAGNSARHRAGSYYAAWMQVYFIHDTLRQGAGIRPGDFVGLLDGILPAKPELACRTLARPSSTRRTGGCSTSP